MLPIKLSLIIFRLPQSYSDDSCSYRLVNVTDWRSAQPQMCTAEAPTIPLNHDTFFVPTVSSLHFRPFLFRITLQIYSPNMEYDEFRVDSMCTLQPMFHDVISLDKYARRNSSLYIRILFDIAYKF
jgi:hypothetical protein